MVVGKAGFPAVAPLAFPDKSFDDDDHVGECEPEKRSPAHSSQYTTQPSCGRCAKSWCVPRPIAWWLSPEPACPSRRSRPPSNEPQACGEWRPSRRRSQDVRSLDPAALRGTPRCRGSPPRVTSRDGWPGHDAPALPCLFTQRRGTGILRSPCTESCIAPVLSGQSHPIHRTSENRNSAKFATPKQPHKYVV
jgi:hypothetical protein